MAQQSFNRVQLLGNLDAEPELRVTPQGTDVATFRVATDYTYRTADEQEHTETEWTTIEVWCGLATTCATYLHTGSRVFVEGRLRTRAWQDAEGVTHERTEVRAERVIFLDDRRDAQGRRRPEDMVQIDEFAPFHAKFG